MNNCCTWLILLALLSNDGCGCGCNNNNSCGGTAYSNDCGCNNNARGCMGCNNGCNSLWIILLLLVCGCGNGNSNMFGLNGCGNCGNNCGC